MLDTKFIEINKSIQKVGWFFFGKKEFECSGLTQDYINYYLEREMLPHPCNQCYKALIFWEGNYSETNLMNFLKMINSFPMNYMGKLNKRVVVFYFRDKNEMTKFMDYLSNKMNEFDIKGKTQWRRACKKYQDLKPQLWKNAKEFALDKSQISNMKLLDQF